MILTLAKELREGFLEQKMESYLMLMSTEVITS